MLNMSHACLGGRRGERGEEKGDATAGLGEGG